jgi:NADPH:quinone reductase-like Zn-dependent oxidoreductase
LKIPDSISFEDASTLGAGVISCGQGLYEQLGLPLPSERETTSSPKLDILVYGASSATGTLAVQLATL